VSPGFRNFFSPFLPDPSVPFTLPLAIRVTQRKLRCDMLVYFYSLCSFPVWFPRDQTLNGDPEMIVERFFIPVFVSPDPPPIQFIPVFFP